MSIDKGTLNKLKSAFQKILPLVDDLADALGVLLLISVVMIAWIFCYLFLLKKFSIILSIGVSVISIIPVLILLRFWFALENLKEIPEVAAQIMDVKGDVSKDWHSVKSGKKGALNFFGQAKKLFEIRSILSSAGDIMGQYFSIGPLINPFYLFLGGLSFVGLFFVFATGVILAGLSLI